MAEIIWYLHNHGYGHLRRFEQIVPHLEASVVTIGSLPCPTGSERHLTLARDDDGSTVDLVANGRLHYAPLQGNGLRRRHAQIAAMVETAQPDLAVVDVSVEVSVFLRLMGIPVVTICQPGYRTDSAHTLLYNIARAVIAPWPREWATDEITDYAHHLGLPAPPIADGHRGSRAWTATVVVGGGGSRINRYLVESMAAAVPGMMIQVAGLTGSSSDNVRYLGHVADVATLVSRSALVVGGAGLNTVAEVAGSGTPFVCLPDDRPFDEQLFTARALARFGAAVVVESPDICSDWSGIFSKALELDPRRIRRFVNPNGWEIAARLIDRAAVATRERVAG